MQGKRTGGTGRERGGEEVKKSETDKTRRGSDIIIVSSQDPVIFLPAATAQRHHVDDASACACHVRRILRIHVGGVCTSVCGVLNECARFICFKAER